MNITKILDELLEWQGPEVHGALGDRTAWGITERRHPQAWTHGTPTKADAKEMLKALYVAPFTPLAGCANDRLLEAVIDDAVLSGAVAAAKRLQWVLSIAMTGLVQPAMVEAIKVQSGNRLLQRYVVERAIRLCRLAERKPEQASKLTARVTRILTFLPVV